VSEAEPLATAEKVLSSAEQHGQGLRAVNEKLADLVTALRDQKVRLARYSNAGGTPPPLAGVPGDEPPPPEAADRPASAELALARAELEQGRREHDGIRERLAEIQRDNERLCDEYASIQEQNSDLVTLFAALERLYGATGRGDALAAIQEIVVNLVGSEELAIFELSKDGRLLFPAHAFGLAPAALRVVTVGCGTIGRVAADGVAFVAAEGEASSPDPGGLTACIPLKLGDRVTGALAVYGLLGHKHALRAVDRELLALIEKHAAAALRTSALREPASTQPAWGTAEGG
jgi:GAF domain-containing protein